MAGPIVVSIIGDNKKLIRAVDGSTSKLGKLGSIAGTAGKYAAAGLAVAGVAAVGMATKMVGAASDSQQSLGATSTVFGKFADKVEADSKRAATQFGLSANDYRENANLIGSLFKNQGVEADKLGGKTKQMIGVGADLAATFGGTTTDAVGALSSAFKGEFDSLEKYGISLKASTISAELAARGQDKLTGAALAAAQQQVTTSLIMKGAGDAQGAFGRETDTLANRQQVLGAVWENLQAKGGTLLLPVLTSLANGAIQLVGGMEKLGPPIAAVAGELGDQLAPVVSSVVAGFNAALPTLISVGTSALEMGTAFVSSVLPAAQSLGGYVVGTFGPVLSSVAGVVTGVVIPAFSAVAGFIAGTLVPKVTAIATAVGSNLRPIFDQVASTITGQVVPAVMKGADQFREMWPQIQKVASFVIDLVGGFAKVASTVLGVVLPPVIKFAGFLISNLIPAVVGAIGVVVNIAAAVIDFGGAVVDGVQQVGKFATAVGDKIGAGLDFIREIPGKVKGFFGNAGEILSGIGGDIVQGLVNGITGAYSKVVAAAQGLIDKIPGPIRKAMGIASPSKVMKQIGGFIVAGLTQGVQEGTSSVADVMSQLGEKITSQWEQLGKGKKPKGGAVSAILQSVSDEVASLKGLAGKYAREAEKLDSARQLAAGVAGSAVNFAGIGGLGIRETVDGDGNAVQLGPTAATIAEDLQAKVQALTAFTQNVDALRQAGLNQTTVDQIIADGVEKGSLTASALVAGGPKAIGAVNALQAQVMAAAGQLGQVAAVNMFGTGQQAAAGFTDGLEDSMVRIDQTAKKLAKKLVKAIKKELGIKSPSRVAMGLARQFTDGIVIQTERDTRRVELAGRNTAGAVVSGFGRPQLTAEAIASSRAGAGLPLALTLTADALDALQRGRAIQADLDAYKRAGGRISA